MQHDFLGYFTCPPRLPSPLPAAPPQPTSSPLGPYSSPLLVAPSPHTHHPLDLHCWTHDFCLLPSLTSSTHLPTPCLLPSTASPPLPPLTLRGSVLVSGSLTLSCHACAVTPRVSPPLGYSLVLSCIGVRVSLGRIVVFSFITRFPYTTQLPPYIFP